MACPVCGSENLIECYPAQVQSAAEVSFSYTFTPAHCQTFRVVRCRDCSHAYCWPIPDNIARHYLDVVDDEYLMHSPSRRLAAEVVLRMLAHYVPSGTVLDVGCATGDFLIAARNCGYQAEGIELSNWSSEIARGRGLVIHQQFLESCAMQYPEHYDMVTLWAVIEHFAQPRLELQHIWRLLMPG
jgi:2-polyprenyl-3-methyl-5-hydroxy-6-metoxy-1,4-benzoquinol methylase